MNSIKSYSKKEVDEYLNNLNKKVEKVEDTRKDLFPPGASVNIIYQLVYKTINQLTKHQFSRLPATVQDTES